VGGRLSAAAAAAIASLMPASRTPAQSLPPEPHWGASIVPADRPELRAALRFDRFTQFSKSGQQFNEIEETAGFNLLSVSYTENTPADPDLFITVTGGAGYSGDQPTRFFQNDYVHQILGQPGVPVGATRDGVEYAASGSLTKWWDGPLLFGSGMEPDGNGADGIGDETAWRTRFFLGAGASTSTIYHEAFAHTGATLLVPDAILGRRLRLTLADRITFPTGEGSFNDLADVSDVAQASVGLVPPHVHSDWPVLEFLGNPEFGVSITYDSGFFQREGRPIPIWFAGAYVQWPTGLRFETWNDFANGTDFGPTYGFLISVDLFTLFHNTRWQW
jgi:hypothetical protein